METDNDTALLIPCEAGEELRIHKTKISKQDIPPWFSIGGNMEIRTKEKGYPKLYAVMSKLSRGANEMFWTLMQTRNSSTNVCVYKVKSPSERKQVSRAYKELHELDLIKRTMNNHYMINPTVIVPLKTFQECKDAYASVENRPVLTKPM